MIFIYYMTELKKQVDQKISKNYEQYSSKIIFVI